MKPGDLVSVVGSSTEDFPLRSLPDGPYRPEWKQLGRGRCGELVLVVAAVELENGYERDLFVLCREGLGWIFSTLVQLRS